MNINETPDHLELGDGTYLRWSDGISFGLARKQWMFSYPGRPHTEFGGVGDYEKINPKVDLIRRQSLDIAGRVFPDVKIINFWNPQPKPAELRSILKNLEIEFKRLRSIDERFKSLTKVSDINGFKDWKIELYSRMKTGTISKIVTISDFLKNGDDAKPVNLSKKDNEIEHQVIPLLKKNPNKLKTLSKKAKSDLYNYFKDRGVYDKADERLFKMLYKEMVEYLEDFDLITENPDGVMDPDNDGKMIAFWRDKEAMPFGKSGSHTIVGIPKMIHAEMANRTHNPYLEVSYNIEKIKRSLTSKHDFDSSGRIWPQKKVIAFWNPQPKPNQLAKVLKEIEKAYNDRMADDPYFKPFINQAGNPSRLRITDNWRIEYYDDEREQTDYGFGGGETITVKEYKKKGGAGGMSQSEQDIEHQIPALLKKGAVKRMSSKQKKDLYAYFKAKGTLNKAEERLYKVLYKEMVEDLLHKDVELLIENPDSIDDIRPNGFGYFTWDSGDNYPFGNIHLGNSIRGFKGHKKEFMLVGRKNTTHHEITKDMLKYDNPTLFKNFKLTDPDIEKFKHKLHNIERGEFKIKGRIWTDKKVISFWNPQPKPNELKSILRDIEEGFAVIHGKRIRIGDDWLIEYWPKGKVVDYFHGDNVESTLIPIKEYIRGKGSSEMAAKENAVQHLINPIVKNPDKIQNMTDKQKKALWDYFKDKKAMNKQEKTFYKILYKEYFLPGFDTLLVENPDNSLGKGFMDSDAIPFIYSPGGKESAVGIPGKSHQGGVYSRHENTWYYKDRFKSYISRDGLHGGSGRLWLRAKRLSFWNPQPTPKELKTLIRSLNKEFKERIKKDPIYAEEIKDVGFTRINIDNSWMVEVYTESDPNVWENAPLLITVGAYLKRNKISDMSAEMNDIEHNLPALMKKDAVKRMSPEQKTKLYDYFKAKGRLNKKEERFYKMLYKEIVEELEGFLLTESPDKVLLPDGSSLSWKADAWPFVIDRDDKVAVFGDEGDTHGSCHGIFQHFTSYWGDIPNPTSKQIAYKKEIDKADPFVGIQANYGNGRVWIRDKVLSFWNPQPNPSKLKKWLKLISRGAKFSTYGKEIKFDKSWQVEMFSNSQQNRYGDWEIVVPLYDYLSGKFSGGDMTAKRIEHMVDPIVKNPKRLNNMSSKQKKSLYDYFKAKGRLNKKEERLYKMLYKEMIEDLLSFDHVLNESEEQWLNINN